MKIDIITLFPSMFSGFIYESIIKRAIEKEKVKINIINLRDYSEDIHRNVDDYPFGGGSGMVLRVEPVYKAIEALKTKDSKIILMTPQGQKYSQKKAYSLTNEKHLIIICGHYEGFDERIRAFVDEEISIGDYVLTGGEIPAMAITDSIVRLIDGVIKEESHLNDSFNNNLLDAPVYTKPREFMGMEVPEVLLSGNHKLINEWRLKKQLERTEERRPDLLEKS
jgi:tRNA (guanine-N1)-methyltransferase